MNKFLFNYIIVTVFHESKQDIALKENWSDQFLIGTMDMDTVFDNKLRGKQLSVKDLKNIQTDEIFIDKKEMLSKKSLNKRSIKKVCVSYNRQKQFLKFFS